MIRLSIETTFFNNFQRNIEIFKGLCGCQTSLNMKELIPLCLTVSQTGLVVKYPELIHAQASLSSVFDRVILSFLIASQIGLPSSIGARDISISFSVRKMDLTANLSVIIGMSYCSHLSRHIIDVTTA